MPSIIELKNKVKLEVDNYRETLEKIAIFLYNNPELGSEEYKAYKLLTDTLGKNGFRVEKELLGIPTAFAAYYPRNGDGPKVAVIAEYDALPGVGHGCGHNLIAASAVGAGLATSKLIDDLVGEVVVVGTPAEEGRGPSGGSKVILAEKGFWRGIDSAIMLHPGNIWSVGGQSLGVGKVNMVFKGQTSHAAASPHRGRNALNAATLAYMATHMLRQEAKRDANLVIHGIIPEGGMANNIIPDRAVLDLGVRSSEQDYLLKMMDKIALCGEGAAMAMGVDVEIIKEEFYSSKKLNIPLIKALWQNYKEQGVPIRSWEESIRAMPLASTDFGNLSYEIPATSSSIKSAPEGTPGHSVQLADATITKEGFDSMIIGTKALAMTLVEQLADPSLLIKAKEYFDSN